MCGWHTTDGRIGPGALRLLGVSGRIAVSRPVVMIGCDRPPEPPRPGLARKENEPPIPEGVDTKTLHRAVRAELRGLPKDLAEIVASHLVVAGELIEEDPELAYAHAEAARRRAARLPIVREATAETAYAAGLYDVALSEFRALRRMTGPTTIFR